MSHLQRIEHHLGEGDLLPRREAVGAEALGPPRAVAGGARQPHAGVHAQTPGQVLRAGSALAVITTVICQRHIRCNSASSRPT